MPKTSPPPLASAQSTATVRKVLLLDDHPLVCEALAMRIASEPDLSVCATAGEPSDALRAVEKHRPDVAIIDLSLRHGHGLDVIKMLHTKHPEIRLLVFSMHDETVFGERALHSGAHGYVMKHEPPERIVDAIREVLGGKSAISSRLQQRLIRGAASRRSNRLATERLSNREMEVFQFMGQGLATKEIAARLQRQTKTIETFRARIKRKLGVGTISELIACAARWTMTH